MGVSTLKLDSGIAFGYKKENKEGGVMLGTRIKIGNELHNTFEAIAAEQQMNLLCPSGQFKVGPYGDQSRSKKKALRTGAVDDRHFLIAGWKDAYTPLHVDSGVQTVLYHNVEGLNRFIGMPGSVAAHLWAAQNEFAVYPDLTFELEHAVLDYALEKGVLEYAELEPGESLLILPRAGHAVLTGDYKVVLAGEWHWHAEADELNQLKYTPQPTPSRLAKEKQQLQRGGVKKDSAKKRRGTNGIESQLAATAAAAAAAGLQTPAPAPTSKVQDVLGEEGGRRKRKDKK